jgi:hypothetical protein
MILRTEISPEKFDFEINHSSRILTIGSCFSDVMGGFLFQNKFKVSSNPFGTVYNLKSISDLIQISLGLKGVTEEWITERDGVYFHYGYHSEFYAVSKELLLTKIREASRAVGEFLKKTDLVIVTLGTSWVYELDDSVVSNCHKVPASKFTKRLLSYEEQQGILEELVKLVQGINPEIRVVFTVSPVRHIKDGLVENSVSKSILRILCDSAIKKFEKVYYFPSYEIMLDDLRDYRFYKADLIHPDEVAERHIIEQFSKAVFSDETVKIISEWSKIRMALNHRSFNPNSAAHGSFLVTLQSKIAVFKPYFDVREELQQVSAQLEKNLV